MATRKASEWNWHLYIGHKISIITNSQRIDGILIRSYRGTVLDLSFAGDRDSYIFSTYEEMQVINHDGG